uniref:NudC domain-containing protein 3 n=1 Tax=Sphaerodactylus townsendi TaxID=933632 RepID=A0ACB8EYI0_9SAUR
MERIQEHFQGNPDSYNGAVRENYTWSQDYSDLEIKVPVPKHILKGRQEKGLCEIAGLLSQLGRASITSSYTQVLTKAVSPSVYFLLQDDESLNVIKVSVDMGSSSLRVAVMEGSGHRVLMEGALTHKINTENSVWSLEPGKCVLINLSKVGEYWWSAILEGEEQIDIDKINKERSMATVDEEEHAVLDRLNFDYHQKLQGKPQSHELVNC